MTQMFHSPPYKKDLTPFARGGKVVKHVGKGAKEQSSRFGETMTGGNPYARMANMYPKPTDVAPSGGSLGGPPMDQQTPPVPQGQRPPNTPTAMMPPSGGDAGAMEEE
jgi:hypothetical protein